MKNLLYLVLIGIFVMVAGMTTYAFAIDDNSGANYISILKKHAKGNDGGSTTDPGDVEDPGDAEVSTPTVTIKPETINLKRHGIFVAIIHLPETIDVGLLDTETILLSIIDPMVFPVTGTDDTGEAANAIGDFAPETSAPFTLLTTVTPTKVLVVEATNSAIALFPNQGVTELIKNSIDVSTLPAMVTFEVQWMLTTDSTTIYEATDDVRVINPGNGSGKGNGKGSNKGNGKGGGAK
jgi:hypothetical protein